MRQGKLTVLIRVWPLLLKGSPSHAANHLFGEIIRPWT